MLWKVLIQIKDKTDVGIEGVEWATWQTAPRKAGWACGVVGRSTQ